MLKVKFNGWAGRARPDDFMASVGEGDEQITASVYSDNGRDIIAEITGDSDEHEAEFANHLYDHALLQMASRGHTISTLEKPVQERVDR